MAQGTKACPRQQARNKRSAKQRALPSHVLCNTLLPQTREQVGGQCLSFATLQQQRQSPEVENPGNVELTELHSSQHRGEHSEGERHNQTERHVCRQAKSSIRPLAKFPAITGTRQGEMLLISSASLPRHTKQLQFWHSYFSASVQLCVWALQHVEQRFCGCFLAEFLLPDAYACQEPKL